MTRGATTATAPPGGWPDAAFIERAVAQAHPGALRMALYQQTRHLQLAAMQVEHREVRGGSMTVPVVARGDRARLRELAFEYLRRGTVDVSPAPTVSEAADLLAMYGSPVRGRHALQLAYEELAFDDNPRGVAWRRRPADAELADTSVTIVGAGISGLTVAIRLSELGLPFTIVERQPAIGGTWQLNGYPGARVDVTNFLYQFKFEKHHPWTSAFAGHSEIRQYLQDIADKYGITPHVQLGTTLETAEWDDARAAWLIRVRRPDGTTETRRSRILVAASGLFSTANTISVAGMETFGGRIVHTTTWDHDYPLEGKRIALIGTGSSGSQLMPHLARAASALTVFQRTPNWVVPVDGWHAQMTPEQQWLLASMPYYWNWYCYATFLADMQIQPLQVFDPDWQHRGGLVSERNDRLRAFLTEHIRTTFAARPDLIGKCTPDYPPAARRLVIDNGWYDALLRPDVELVTTPVEAFTSRGLRTADGREHPADLVVLGSGFQTWRYLFPMEITGRGGITPQHLWAPDGARAYLGTLLPGFPNLFIFYGPNGQPRAGGFHGWAETFARYVAQLITTTLDCGAQAVAVTRAAYDDYNRRLDDAMESLIWGSLGSGSYYLNEHGRPGVNIPFTVEELYGMLAEPDLADMEMTHATPAR